MEFLLTAVLAWPLVGLVEAGEPPRRMLRPSADSGFWTLLPAVRIVLG